MSCVLLHQKSEIMSLLMTYLLPRDTQPSRRLSAAPSLSQWTISIFKAGGYMSLLCGAALATTSIIHCVRNTTPPLSGKKCQSKTLVPESSLETISLFLQALSDSLRMMDLFFPFHFKLTFHQKMTTLCLLQIKMLYFSVGRGPV